jgi:hypothetical protein
MDGLLDLRAIALVLAVLILAVVIVLIAWPTREL